STDASFRTTLQAEPRSNALILRAANPARAALVRTLVDKLDRAPADSGNGAAGNIYVVYLKNADAVRLATTLRAAMAAGGSTAGAGGGAGQQPAVPGSLQAASQQLSTVSGGASSAATAPLSGTAPPSTGGQIQADPSTNSLIITAPEPQYRQLRAVIDRLDGRRAQVMVETLIVEVNARKAAEFGVQWQTALNGGGRNAAVLGNNSSLAGANIIDLALGLATRNPAIRPSSGFNFGIGHKSNGEYVLGFLARFLEGDGEGNVLSTPNLLTLDNEEAKIVIGQNVPFITGQYASTNGNSSTINPFTTVERKDVGLTLRVRPQINENGSLKLVIFQEVSNVDQATRADVNGPTTNKRSIESTVMVDDGSIVMLGGLLQDDYSGSTEKIPLAGDIPVLGNLFKSEVRNRNKTNLMVFIRPVVMRDGATTDAFAADRYDAIRSQQLALQPEPATMLRNVDAAPVLPALAPPPSEAERASRRIEGTRLVPPPLASPDVRIHRAAAGQGPMRGVLPATADPLSRRELP
ncbi:MAG: type II secretion system protein GspD, partial [Comamonadaceae bacterium]